MKRLGLIIVAVLALSTAAAAQIWIMGNGGMGNGGKGGRGGCSNSLDFSQACNSEYLVGLL